jgi:hypothetical protein
VAGHFARFPRCCGSAVELPLFCFNLTNCCYFMAAHGHRKYGNGAKGTSTRARRYHPRRILR